MLRIFKELKSSDVWNSLQDHWNLYQKKHYAKSGESEEECEASDKDDWSTKMPDGDEIGDVEEVSVDDDSSPPRNRQRLSC